MKEREGCTRRSRRGELGDDCEPRFVEQFLERIEKRLEERVGNKPAERDHVHHAAPMIPLVFGSLGLSMPLLAIAGDKAGLAVIRSSASRSCSST